MEFDRGNLPGRDPAWSLVQDHVNPNLLFLGTEFGLSFTVDGGEHWVRLKGGMPVTPIRDLEIQRREGDLVAASFGRGFFVLDDYSTLRAITPQALADEGILFAAGRKARVYDELGYYRAQGDNAASPNPPMSALLTYYLRDDAAGGVKYVLTVADAAGRQARQLDAPAKAGVHRTPWDLREPPPAAPAGGRGAGQQRTIAAEGAEEDSAPPAGRGGRGGAAGGGGRRGSARTGPLVKSGTYTVTLSKLADGQLTRLGQPQTIEVVPLEK